MATLTKVYKHNTLRIGLTLNFDKFMDSLIPRPCMLISAGLFLTGMSIPTLMFFQFIPVNFVVGAIGLALTALGGTLLLVNCGEI